MDSTVKRASQFSLRYRTALLLFLAAAGFYAWTEHRAHLFGVLPYLILLLCPFIHLFMHRGHNHSGDRHGS